MLTRKQQWRRTRVRHPRDGCVASGKADLEGHHHLHERADSDQTALSSYSSFDSLRDGDDDSCCSTVPLVRPAPARERSVSFQQEVQVFLVTHKSELDTSAKQALWWTGRDAAINKRAWLNHLGQPGCGRQSAGRPRPKHQHQQQQQDCSPHFLGAGGGALSAHNSNNNGSGFGRGAQGFGEETAATGAAELLPADGVGILGCRCDACLTEGDEHELTYEQQEQVRRRRWRQQEREEERLPPRYDMPPPPYNNQLPPPYNHQPPRYSEAYQRPAAIPPPATAAASRDPWARVAAREPSKSWPSPEDWDREDDLGGKGSRSYSPGSASGTSPLYEACETYGDEGSYFF